MGSGSPPADLFPNPTNLPLSKTPPTLKRHRSLSLPDVWFEEPALKHVILKMKFHSLSSAPTSRHKISRSITSLPEDNVSEELPKPDLFSSFSDEILLKILSKLPASHCIAISLVCRRWLHLTGRLVLKLKLLDWAFLEAGRIFRRFPNLNDIDIAKACVDLPRNSGVVVTHKMFTVHVNTQFSDVVFMQGGNLLPPERIDNGLRLLSEGYPNLRKIVVSGAGKNGLLSIARECDTLQELELHSCSDSSLMGISGCKNLQIVKLIGSVDGFYSSVVSDIGLTRVAQGCRRLVRLELCGCEGSYDGMKAIGQCCQMLEELTLCSHRMDGGWLPALSFCRNLKTLRLESCKGIDSSPGPEKHLGCCPTLEELHLQGCQMSNKMAVKALFLVCRAVREIALHNCWGMENETFSFVGVCRRLKSLSLEGCSLLTVQALESVILFLKELQVLSVVSCKNIKESDITPAIASLFSELKELKWQPDSNARLFSALEETGLGNKGGRFFNR